MSEANPRATEDSSSTLRGQNEWPTAPVAVTHPLRRPRNVVPDPTVGALRSAAWVGSNPSGRTTADLSTRLIDPHPPRFAFYTGPDRRRHRATTSTTPARRRTDSLYSVSGSTASQHRPSTAGSPLVGSVAPASTDLASAVARPTSPHYLSRVGTSAVSSVATPIPKPGETRNSLTFVPSPQSALPVGKDVLVELEAARRWGPPAGKSPDSIPADVSLPKQLTPPVPAPRSPSQTVFAPQPQAKAEASTEATATQVEARDHHEPASSRFKAHLVQKLTKRRWVLLLAGVGILGLLVLGLTKCSSDQRSKANKTNSKTNQPNKTSSSVETIDPDSPDAAAPKVIQRTVVGGRDSIGNGSIATDATTQTPRGVTVFADGRKLIGDATSVRIIGRDGRIRALPDPSGLLQKPGAATPFGNDIVIIDQASAALVRIKADGTVTQLSNDEQFRAPSSVTQFDDETLVVADPGAGTLFTVAVNGDSTSVSLLDVNPPLLRPTAVTHRGGQVLAVVDDADGAIYEVTKGTSRKIAQARSQRVGVSDPMTVNTSDAEAISSPATEVVSDQTTAISPDTTTAAVEKGSSESRSAATASAVLTLPEPVIAIASRRDGSLWVLGRTSTLLLITADNRGIPSVVSQSLNWPQGLGVDARGQALVADTGAHKVSAIDEKGAITNLAGALHSPTYEANTTAADDLTLQSATGFATSSTGDLYVADESANTIWGITAGGASYRLVGNGTRAAGSDGGQGPDTPTAAPTSLATAPDGNTYFAEPSTGRVRKVDTKGIVSTVFDQFGGPITLPEAAPVTPAATATPTATAAGESASNPADPAAPTIATTTIAPPSPEVLQERRRLANIEVGRLGLIAVTNNGTLVAVDTWKGTLGTISEGIFIPKESLESRPVGLSIATQGDTETFAVSERKRVELFSGSVKDPKGLIRTAVEPTSGTASKTGTKFGGITSTEDGAFAVVTLSSLGSVAGSSIQPIAPGIPDVAGGPHLRFASSPTGGLSSDRQAGSEASKAASTATPGFVSKVPLSGPHKLGALGALPTGELVQFAANGGLFARFPSTSGPASTGSSTVSPTGSQDSTAPVSSDDSTVSTAPSSVLRWLTNPPQSTKPTTVGRTPIQDPGAIASQTDGTLVFAENGSGKVRMLRNGNLTVLAGSGRRAPAETRTDATTATFDRLSAIAPHANGGIDFSTSRGLTGIDSVGLVRRNEDPTLAGAALTVTNNDETVIVNNRTGLLQRITKSGTFEDLPGTRIVNASQLTAVGERFYLLSGAPSKRVIAVRRGTSEATVTLPADTIPLAFTADEAGTLYVLDTQHRLLRLRQEIKADGVASTDGVAAAEQLDGWKLLDTTKLRFADDRYLGSPDTSDPQAMAIAGPGAVAISDAGTDSIVVVRFPQ